MNYKCIRSTLKVLPVSALEWNGHMLKIDDIIMTNMRIDDDCFSHHRGPVRRRHGWVIRAIMSRPFHRLPRSSHLNRFWCGEFLQLESAHHSTRRFRQPSPLPPCIPSPPSPTSLPAARLRRRQHYHSLMQSLLSSVLSMGGRNAMSIQPESPNPIRPTPTVMRQKKRSYLACQRFIGKPMTRMEAQKKLDSCKNFRDMVAQEGDVIQNAIGLEYGARLRSCVIQSKRNPYHHGNRAHYWDWTRQKHNILSGSIWFFNVAPNSHRCVV